MSSAAQPPNGTTTATTEKKVLPEDVTPPTVKFIFYGLYNIRLIGLAFLVIVYANIVKDKKAKNLVDSFQTFHNGSLPVDIINGTWFQFGEISRSDALLCVSGIELLYGSVAGLMFLGFLTYCLYKACSQPQSERQKLTLGKFFKYFVPWGIRGVSVAFSFAAATILLEGRQ
eukprot:m.136988 g.136988  ORF g.136988 m.136988 type:complete len:172 (+) comp14742_c0_seq6:165-680(+)